MRMKIIHSHQLANMIGKSIDKDLIITNILCTLISQTSRQQILVCATCKFLDSKSLMLMSVAIHFM